LIVGGGSRSGHGGENHTLQTYDPATKIWNVAVDAPVGGVYPTATLLADGTVLVVGELFGSADEQGGAAVFDPESGKWRMVSSPGLPRGYHSATLLSDGRVLVVGGYVSERAEGAFPNHVISRGVEWYSPFDRRWAALRPMDRGRVGHTASRLPNGDVLIVGGESTRGAMVRDAVILKRLGTH
jgi:N-acetylneuraminic acid mutarotase